jgi:hemerythrin-like domain-containing protein
MKATELLMQEHAAIKQSLMILNKMCDKLQSGELVDRSHLEQIVDFIRNFADKCHHGKEEDILFDEMCKIGFSKEVGPISVMLSEHGMGREFVKGFSDAVELYKEGDKNAVSAIVGNARKYSALLDQHIDKENNILYPMADARLSQEQQMNMLEDFDKFEQLKMGPGKHAEFHKILNDLSASYLS